MVAMTVGLSCAFAQTCVPGRILPVGSLTGSLSSSNCKLSDSTAYDAYRLDLPVRGQIRIALDSGQSDLLLILRDSTGAQLASGPLLAQPIEAGSYTVLVNARTAGQAGAYTVQTNFTAEPGMLCSAFPSLGLNQTVAGVLGGTGCRAPDGSPFEPYLLTTFGAGTLTVSVSQSDYTPEVLLRDRDGRPLASGFNSASIAVAAGTSYQVLVSSTGGTGPYQLTTSFQPAVDEACLPRNRYSASANDANAIDAASCWITIEGSGDQVYYNYYTLTVPGPATATLTVSSADFNPTLVLLDASGNTLLTDADGDPLFTGASSAGFSLQLASGNYTAIVYSDILSGGNYNLSYTLTDPSPQPCLPVSTETSGGMLLADSCRTAIGLTNINRITLPSAGTLHLTMMTGDFVPQLAITDAKDNLVVVDHDYAGIGAAHITADLQAGVYSVLPSAISGLGSYQLTSSFTPHDVTPCGTPVPLVLNGTYYQMLGLGTCRDTNGQPLDLFSFTLPVDGVIASVVASSDIDGFLTLTDSSGNVLRRDDNTYGNKNPLIVQSLSAGTYNLQVRDAGASSGGPYALALYVALGLQSPFCASRGSLPMSGSVTGSINSAGCQYLDNTLADVYRLDMLYDGMLDLRLNSSEFDAYLILLDIKGDVIAQDDDGGSGTNARINMMLKGGTYYVVAKPFSDYFSQGNYTLSAGSQ